ncbi:MAG: TrkH family potassium uptake protein [Aquificaceae bacterium]|nr:MAG: TrkH family potassium uptake protein [Aquificaceae bacterium]
MRFCAVYKTLSGILLALSTFLVLPAIYSLFVGDGCWRDFLLPLVFSLLLFLPSLRCQSKDLNLKEALVIVTSVWFLFPAVSSLVYILGAHISDPINAYFESVSGFTTTGATILNDIENLPPSILLWRSLTQWLGGLGFIVFSFSLLPFIRVSYHLVKFESARLVEERLTPSVADVVKTVLGIYLFLTLLEVLILRFLGLDWFQALNHALTTVSTGGFSPKNEGIKAFDSFGVEVVISLFMLLGSVNLAVYYKSWKERKPLKVFSYFETKSLLILTFTGVIIATLDLWKNNFYPTLLEDFRYALFQVVSAVTTTGFASDDFSKYPPFVVSVMFFLTLIGGSAGSTAGGIKQFRFILLLQVLRGEVKKTLHPRLVVKYSLGGKTVDVNLMHGVLSFVFVYAVTLFAFATLLTIGGHDLVTSFSASISCLTSFGPGLGQVGPMDNFNTFSDWQKLLLTLEMIMGRLEILPVVSVFYLLVFERLKG